jgi:hypothetical protein
MVDCPKCGGYGGSDASEFGDRGWHPCFFCGETGFVSEEAYKAYELGMEIHNNFVNPDRVWVGIDYDEEDY